jgi:hypothetical protein
MQHACTSAERPRTTSGAVQANRIKSDGASSTPLGPVWDYARYPLSPHIPPVDAACVFECGAPTHDERRRASKSHEWCLGDATRARVGVRTLPTEPVYTTCRSSMRARVRSAHARRTAPSKQIARMVPQRRHLSLCGSTHATEGPSTCRLSMQHACTSAERPRTTDGAVQANRTNEASATPLGPVWVYARYPLSPYIPPVDAACVHECGAPTHGGRRRASKSHE